MSFFPFVRQHQTFGSVSFSSPSQQQTTSMSFIFLFKRCESFIAMEMLHILLSDHCFFIAVIDNHASVDTFFLRVVHVIIIQKEFIFKMTC